MTTFAHPVSARARVAGALRTETGLARLALGATALHVVDDAFLQPQPGTSAADHLAGGLIPTVVLVATAWAYPRLRAGVRGSLALLFGFLALLAEQRGRLLHEAGRPVGRRLHRTAVDRRGALADRPRHGDALEVTAD